MMTAIVAGALVQQGLTEMVIGVVAAVIPSILDIERVELRPGDRRLMVQLRLDTDVRSGALSEDELYNRMPAGIREVVNRFEFADFVQRLRDAGYASGESRTELRDPDAPPIGFSWLTQGGIGRFFHHGWEIAPGEDSLLARMASYHEFGHAALNSTTAWGSLLQHLDIAHSLTGDPAIAGVLNAAVAASRHAHEVSATQVSISVFGSSAAGAERLLAAQPGYARFLTMAKKLGPGSDDAERWADWDGLGEIRRAAVTACMQSPAVLRLLEDGTERFRLSAVPSRDWPDRRLRTLTRLAPELWAARQPPADVDKRLHYAINVAAEALRGAGHPTLSRDEYRTLLPELAAELNRLAAGTGQEIELNLDGDTGVPDLFGAEAVRVRTLLPAAVGELFDPADVDHLATDTVTGRHLYLCARRMHALRTQFALCPDPGLPDDAPVCAIVTPSGRSGQVDELWLTVLPRPEQIHQLDVTAPIISCVSLDCLRDNAWRRPGSARCAPAPGSSACSISRSSRQFWPGWTPGRRCASAGWKPRSPVGPRPPSSSAWPTRNRCCSPSPKPRRTPC